MMYVHNFAHFSIQSLKFAFDLLSLLIGAVGKNMNNSFLISSYKYTFAYM